VKGKTRFAVSWNNLPRRTIRKISLIIITTETIYRFILRSRAYRKAPFLPRVNYVIIKMP
jgi:hypothetical protein